MLAPLKTRVGREIDNPKNAHSVQDVTAPCGTSVPPIKATASPPSRFSSIAEFCALPPAEPSLIRGYLDHDSLSAWYGLSGTAKSFLGIDITCHVATGRDWRGCPVSQGFVLYLAGEGANGLKKRFKAWFEYYGLSMRNIAVSTVPLALCEPGNAALLVEDIKREIHNLCVNPALIILDTLNTHYGPGDENSTADMTRFVTGMREIRQATGAHIAAVHHCGLSAKDRSRGSGVLRNGVDWEYRIERQPETPFITLACTKSKDAEPPPPLMFELTSQPLPWSSEGGVPMTSCVLQPVRDHTPRPTVLPRPQRIALDVLTALCGASVDGWTYVADWRKAALDAGITGSESRQARSAAFKRALEGLIDTGKIGNEGEKWQPIAEHQQCQQTSKC